MTTAVSMVGAVFDPLRAVALSPVALLRVAQPDLDIAPSALLSSELAATLLQGAVTTGVAALCAHLWTRYRRPWFGWFALAWTLYVARLLCILSFLGSGERVWLYWHQVTTGWTALVLLWASLVFLRQPKARPAYLLLALFPPLWSYVAIYQLDHFLWAVLPAVSFLSAATIWTGWVFWRHHRLVGSTGARLLAAAFALWGLHHLDYPILRARGAWTPWGYYLDIAFELLVAAGLVLLVLDDLGRGVRALSALSGDLQRRGPGDDPLDALLTRPLALPGVNGAAMFLFDPAAAATSSASTTDGTDDESASEMLERVLAQARAMDDAEAQASRADGAPPRGRFVRGKGVAASWPAAPIEADVQEALRRVRVTRRPQVVAATGQQPFIAVLPVGSGPRLVGALVMAGEVRNPFTALDDDFLLAFGQQVGAALDQWALDRELAARTRALEQLSVRMVRQHEDERRRLSRELHDETAQVFSAVKMQVATLRSTLSDDARSRVERLLALVDTGIASIRQVTSALRPSLLDDLGLRPALQSLVTDFRERSGLVTHFEAPATLPTLSGDAELAVFRAVQEALSNVVRHAEAQTVRVAVTHEAVVGGDRIVVTVHDDGRGFAALRGGRLPEAAGRMGLTGMRERLLAVGGTLQLANRAGGAELRIVVPVSQSTPLSA
ncbi:MAG: GAF domain-containing sensor histidine kinase [Gemmatimonadetes bacterium]|nr:GAF domain-containing sensor histidine kinase [Gemmatimonadota bacterium]